MEECNINVTVNEIQDFINKRLIVTGVQDKTAIVMVGGPGSGKSSGKEETLLNLGKKNNEFVNIDPDEILTTLFNNNNDCRSQVNKINDDSFGLSIEQDKNIIFDGTGKDFNWYSKNVIELLTNKGYKVHLVIVNNDVNTVLSRIEERAQRTGRYVNKNYTETVYTELDKAIPRYLGLTCESVNGNIYLYDNSSQLKLVYSTYCKDNEKKLKCVLDVCNIQNGGKNKRKGKKSKKAGKKSKKAGKKSRKSRRKTYRRRRR